jgi:hypothetical protein
MDAERFTGTLRGEAGPFSELPQLSPSLTAAASDCSWVAQRATRAVGGTPTARYGVRRTVAAGAAALAPPHRQSLITGATTQAAPQLVTADMGNP